MNSITLPTTFAQLAERYALLVDHVLDDHEADDLADAIAEELATLEGSITDKADAIVALIRELDAGAAAISTEVQRLQRAARTRTARTRWLRSYLLTNMLAANVTSIKGLGSTIRVATSPPSLQITQEDVIPDQFWEHVPQLKKEELKQALLDGETIEGARIVRDNVHLVIR